MKARALLSIDGPGLVRIKIGQRGFFLGKRPAELSGRDALTCIRSLEYQGTPFTATLLYHFMEGDDEAPSAPKDEDLCR